MTTPFHLAIGVKLFKKSQGILRRLDGSQRGTLRLQVGGL